MEIRKLCLLLVLILSLSLPLYSATQSRIDIPQYKEALELLEKGTKSSDVTTLNKSRSLLLDLYNSDYRDYLTAYNIAHADNKLVEIYMEKNNNKMGFHYIEDALKYLNESIEMNDRFSDAYCLLAGVLGYKIQMMGLTGGILYKKQSIEALKKAMALNPNNPDIYIGFGISCIATPLLFGGDLDKGIDYLNKALELDPQKHRAYIWLAKAYRRKGQEAKAKSMILKALKNKPNDLGAMKELALLTK